MNEETQKNPLEILIEQMQDIVNNQKEQNSILNQSVKEFHSLLNHAIQSQKNLIDDFEYTTNEINHSLTYAHNQRFNAVEENLNKINSDILGIDKRMKKIINASINELSDIKLSLSEKDRKALSDTDNQIKKFNFNFYLLVGITVLSLLTVSISVYSASNFYKTSVLSKEEVRQNVLDDIQASHQEIYSQSYFQALLNERKIIGIWKNANPNDSKSYLEFRENYLEKYQTRNQPYFESLDSDETSDGYGMKLKKGFFN